MIEPIFQDKCKIEYWFPKQIYVGNEISLPLIDQLKIDCVDVIGSSSYRNNSLNVDSTHQTNRYLHNEKESFKKLSKTIMEHCTSFILNCGYSEEYLKYLHMQEMWCNVSYKGDYIYPHSHPGAFISGVYYVESVHGNRIRFYDDLSNSLPGPTFPSEKCSRFTNYTCDPGRLLLFFSNLVHSTYMQDEEGRKIAISFNIILKSE